MENPFLTLACKSNHYKRVDNSIKLTTLFLLLLLFSPSTLLSSRLSHSHGTKVFSSDSQQVLPSLRLFDSGYGPEDIVVDSLHNPPRLLVSCASRRPEYPKYGEIEAIDPAKGIRMVMTRVDEPASLVFRPHGISLVEAGEIQYLYVISHDDLKGIHPIIRYQVDEDTLVFVEALNTKLLVSPNALQGYPDGSLLVCNDAADRNNMKEKIFRQKKGNILYYDGLGSWAIVADKLGMPAGLTGLGNRIFVSGTLENKLYSYQFIDGQLTDKKQVCVIKGPDNIRINNNLLIVTSHSKPIKFILHTKNKSRNSPSLVFSVDPRTGKSTRLFYNNGKLISAASVALILNNQLVIGQIFEPFIGLYDINP
jgi:hypothetical protein